MNRPELYDQSVNRVLDAYNAKTLLHGVCKACAVGNILQTHLWANFLNSSIERINENSIETTHSQKLAPPGYMFVSGKTLATRNGEIGFVSKRKLVSLSASPATIQEEINNMKKSIEDIGYSWQEIARIEKAFESSIANTPEGYVYYKTKESSKGQYIGLCAVLNELAIIHEIDVEKVDQNQTRLNTIATEVYELVIA